MDVFLHFLHCQTIFLILRLDIQTHPIILPEQVFDVDVILRLRDIFQLIIDIPDQPA